MSAAGSPALLEKICLEHDGTEVLRVAEGVGTAAELLVDGQVGPFALRQCEAETAGLDTRVTQAGEDERGTRPRHHLQVTAGETAMVSGAWV